MGGPDGQNAQTEIATTAVRRRMASITAPSLLI
jgi:hypothetical protein